MAKHKRHRRRTDKPQPSLREDEALNLPNTWLARFARRMVRSRNGKAAVARIIDDGDHPAFVPMWKELARRGYGDVPKDVNVAARISLADLVAPPAAQVGPGAAERALRLVAGPERPAEEGGQGGP